MYSRYELEEEFRESKGERAAIAYLKKKEGERLEKKAKLKKAIAWVSVMAIGVAWWMAISLI